MTDEDNSFEPSSVIYAQGKVIAFMQISKTMNETDEVLHAICRFMMENPDELGVIVSNYLAKNKKESKH